MSARRHRLTVVHGCAVVLEAHGKRWDWDMVDLDADGVGPDDLTCPVCGRVVLGLRNVQVFVGICLGEHPTSSHVPMPSVN